VKTFSWLILFLVGAAIYPCLAQSQENVPLGFEELLLGQHELLSVRLASHDLGLYDALVKPDEIQFSQPEKLVQRIKEIYGLSEEHEKKLTTALRQPLARNGHKACLNDVSSIRCGQLDTESAALIYNESRNDVDLFINVTWLPLAPAGTGYYAPALNAHNALIHQQQINIATSDTTKNISIIGNGALGLGEKSYLSGSWQALFNQQSHYTEKTFRHDDLYVRHDIGTRRYVQAGEMDKRNLYGALGGNFNLSLLPLPKFYGVRLGTTQSYVNNSEESETTTPITLLLSRTTRVDVYRDDELLGTQYLPAGVVKLNSQAFPQGRYLLTLKFYEEGALSRVQQYPFSKTTLQQGPADFQWFTQVGKVAEAVNSAPDVKNPPPFALQSGFRTRLAEPLTITSAVSVLAGESFNETRLDWQNVSSLGIVNLGIGAMANKHGLAGNIQQLAMTKGATLSLYRYQQQGKTCISATHAGQYRCSQSLNATLSGQLAGSAVSLGYSKSRASVTPDVRVDTAPSYPRYADQQASKQTRWQLDISRSFTLNTLLVSARAGIFRSISSGQEPDRGGYIGISLSYVPREEAASDRRHTSQIGGEYRRQHSQGAEMGWQASHAVSWFAPEYRELSVTATGSQGGEMYSQLSGRRDGMHGNVYGTLSHNQGGTSLTGSYNSAFAATSQGFWSGSSAGSTDSPAGVVVSVDADSALSGPAAEVMANGHTYALNFGDSAFLPAVGYQSGTHRIREITSSDNQQAATLSTGGSEQSLFLLPGKIVQRKVKARLNLTYVGRALKENGMPLRDARVINTPAQLDSDGGMLFDSAQRITTLYLQESMQIYACALRVKQRKNAVQFVGEVMCPLIDVAALPDAMRNNISLAAFNNP